MDCAKAERLSNSEYLHRFNMRAAQLRVPLSGSIDLTHRCNLRCVHCYLGPQSDIGKRRGQEMDTDRLLALVDEITAAGCLNLLVTGGDPLIRRDFSSVYHRIKSNGLLVTVFTTGTFIPDEILRLFGDLPPQSVEISLYGATADTYERITGRKGSYEKCISGIHRLLDNKISIKLKTILMTLNQHEFSLIENIAKQLGVPFRFDACLFPCFNGERRPLDLRVSPEDAIEKEFSDPQRLRNWRNYHERCRGISVPAGTLYHCGAGLTSFHIDPYGNLMPCLMTTGLKYDLSGGSFLKGWNEVMPRIREIKGRNDYVCNACETRNLCDYCPAFFELENGSDTIPSEYLCAMGKHRFQMIYH